MKLHHRKEAFSELVNATAAALSLPEIYIEKDYWLTKALKNLSYSAHLNDVVFKGGTSLSKAFGLIDRFSEDIDLAVFAEGKGDSARKKLIKNIEAIATKGLRPVQNDIRTSKGSKFRRTVYEYPKNFNESDFGHASPELLIEINTFTVPEPFESVQLQSYIAEFLTSQNRTDLVNQYNLDGFSFNVLTVRRTLVEKILRTIKDSYSDHPVEALTKRIRHLYDINQILKQEKYRNFIRSSDFKRLCDICVKDDLVGSFDGAHRFHQPLSKAPLFSQLEHWSNSLNKAYTRNFSDLVYGDLPGIDEINEAIGFIGEHVE